MENIFLKKEIQLLDKTSLCMWNEQKDAWEKIKKYILGKQNNSTKETKNK